MSNQRFKMFTPERVSIILLIAALCAWAAVTTCRRIPDDVFAEAPVIPAGDISTYDKTDSTVYVGKKVSSRTHPTKNRKNRKKRKQKKEVKHRDHLNEPVSSH